MYVYVLKEITLIPSGAAKKNCMSRVFCIENLSFWSELADSTLVILLTHISGAFSLYTQCKCVYVCICIHYALEVEYILYIYIYTYMYI